MVGTALPVAGAAGHLQFIGRSHVKGRQKWLKQVLVSVSMFGLQLVWSTEMAYASPYLLSLGLSKAGMSAVFLAGPLSGLIVQPIIGSIADRSTSRFGRRRPVIVIGCLICVISLLVFGYTREVASVFTTRGSQAHSTLTIWLAVFAVYALDFAINGVQATDRALIVDVLPVSQQEEANAWVARLSGMGSILGFWIGNVDLLGPFSFLGDSQIKILSVFASLTLVFAHAITIFAVEERILLSDGLETRSPSQSFSFTDNIVISSLRSLWETFRTLPPPIWDICKVQAFTWGGWFPILFFSTTYVAEIYQTAYEIQQPAVDKIGASHGSDPATRAGSRAMFLQAVFSFVCSVVLPFLTTSLVPTVFASNTGPNARRVRTSDDEDRDRSYNNTRMAWSESILDKILNSRFFPTIPFPWLDLSLLWMIAHLFFAVLMFSTYIVSRVWSATLVIAMLGFCWAVTCWAPTSLLGQEILQDTTSGIKSGRHRLSSEYTLTSQVDHADITIALQERSNPTGYDGSMPTSPNPRYSLGYQDPELNSTGVHPPADVTHPSRTLQIRHSDSMDGSSYAGSSEDGGDEGPPPDRGRRHRSGAPRASVRILEAGIVSGGEVYNHEDGERAVMDEADFLHFGTMESSARTADQAGAILGIANVFVVLPQFLTSFISSIVFAFMAPGAPDQSALQDSPQTGLTLLLNRAEIHGPAASNDAIGFVFRIGGISALVAAWLCWQMRKRRKAVLDSM